MAAANFKEEVAGAKGLVSIRGGGCWRLRRSPRLEPVPLHHWRGRELHFCASGHDSASNVVVRITYRLERDGLRDTIIKPVSPAATSPTKPGSGTAETCGAVTAEALNERVRPSVSVNTWPGANVNEKKLISPNSPVTGSVALKMLVSKLPTGIEKVNREGIEKLPLRETLPFAGVVPLRLPPSEADKVWVGSYPEALNVKAKAGPLHPVLEKHEMVAFPRLAVEPLKVGDSGEVGIVPKAV